MIEHGKPGQAGLHPKTETEKVGTRVPVPGPPGPRSRYQVDIMACGHDVFLTRVRSCDTTSALGCLTPAELARGRRVQNKKEAATRQLLP